MALVYRLENDREDGPYCGYIDWGDYSPYNTTGEHPGPMSDSGLCEAWNMLERRGDYRKYSFGFKDEAQMRAWFYRDDWMRALACFGYAVMIWEVEDEYFHAGHTQAVFRKDYAKLIAKRSPLTYLSSDERSCSD